MKKTLCSSCLIGLLAPVTALAEPGLSSGHVPFLLAIAGFISAGLAFGAVKGSGKANLLRTPLRRWGFGAVLFAVFMFFLVPVILVFGGILITGRTM